MFAATCGFPHIAPRVLFLNHLVFLTMSCEMKLKPLGLCVTEHPFLAVWLFKESLASNLALYWLLHVEKGSLALDYESLSGKGLLETFTQLFLWETQNGSSMVSLNFLKLLCRSVIVLKLELQIKWPNWSRYNSGWIIGMQFRLAVCLTKQWRTSYLRHVWKLILGVWFINSNFHIHGHLNLKAKCDEQQTLKTPTERLLCWLHVDYET